MKTPLLLFGILSGILTTAVFPLNAQASSDLRGPASKPADVKEASPPEVADPAPSHAKLVEKLKAASISPSVRQIVQMSETGIDSEVIKAYVENATVPMDPKVDEIVYLHEHGIPDSIITVMLQRGAKLREQAATAQANAAAQAAQQAAASASTYSAPAPAASPTYTAVSPTYVYPDYYSYGYGYGYPSYSSVVYFPSYRYGYYGGYGRPNYFSSPYRGYFGGSHFSHSHYSSGSGFSYHHRR
jgi:hypothetical protein